MTFEDFLKLSDEDQMEAVWSNTHIAEREVGNYWILLYQVDSFYVELYYDLQQRTICDFKPFFCTELLWPYLHKIDISFLTSKIV